MTKTPALAAAALALALAACATTPTPYAPAATPGGYGFAEQRIENDRVVVRFTGNSATTADLARSYALRRAAETTLANGYDWFQVTSRNTDTRYGGSTGPRVGVGAGGVSGGGASFGGVGVGLSVPLGGGGGGRSSYAETSLEIVMRRGPVPANLADAYDARDVLANLAR